MRFDEAFGYGSSIFGDQNWETSVKESPDSMDFYGQPPEFLLLGVSLLGVQSILFFTPFATQRIRPSRPNGPRDARTSQSLEPIHVFFSKKKGTHFFGEKWEYTQSLIKNGVLMGFFVIKSITLTVLQVGVLNVTLQPEAGNFT